jgi:antirestriction protein ArdC
MTQQNPWQKQEKSTEQLQGRQAKVDEIMSVSAKQIIELIALGQSAGWRNSWKGNPFYDLPHNIVTGHRFTGFNRVVAMMEMFSQGSSDNRFMTSGQVKAFNEASGAQCHIKEDAKTISMLTPIMFNKEAVCQADPVFAPRDEDENVGRKIVFFKPYPIYHASQIDGLPPLPELIAPDWEHDESIEKLIEVSGAEVRHGGDRTYFKPSVDYIELPQPESFENKAAYYAAMLQEWYCWTGHASRENRASGAVFGNEQQIMEQLRAESFSVFAGMMLGLPAIESHSAYIKDWQEKTGSKDGIEDILRCMSEAGKMLDVVLAFKNEQKPDVDWWPDALASTPLPR